MMARNEIVKGLRSLLSAPAVRVSWPALTKTRIMKALMLPTSGSTMNLRRVSPPSSRT